MSTIRVRVAVDGDGYRSATRTSEVELDSVDREEAVRVEGLGRKHRPLAGHPKAAGLSAMVPFLSLALLLFATNSADYMLSAGMVIGALVMGAVAYTSNKLPQFQQLDGTSERVPVRLAQQLTLVGKVHQHRGEEKEIVRVRVGESFVPGRASMYAEYEDGSKGPLLIDLSQEELAEMRVCVDAHDIKIVDA